MDKTQPNLGAPLADQVLHKFPCAALLSGEGGKVQWCNEALMQLVKANASDIIGQPQADVEQHYLKAMPEQPGVFFLMKPDTDEPEYWLKKQELPLDGVTLVTYDNVTDTVKLNIQLNELQNQLDELSTVDTVSGLLNRRAMLQNLEPLVSRSRRYNNPLSVIAMEIIELAAIKQHHGEAAFQHAIKQVSFMLKDTLRWADLVSRTEDSRFVFVLPETDKEAAVLLARKINANITELHISYENVELPVSACFGVSAWEKGNDSVLLLRHANQSLELAKNNGPGSVQDC
ncbi:MAG: GGDEF domain-containing protein [Gammaproteobacteria bacterium]|jgi:diguanylate cyclase (GGDEF)-like protein|nr:GGDEF domain-containing protein [Gammaproteobacteria bacterium]